MSLDANPIALTQRGRIVIEPDGSIIVSDFDGENCSCREVVVLAIGWAIQHLTAEMVKNIERPGGSSLIGEGTMPPILDFDGEEVTPQRLIAWLEAKYTRHHEEEDKWAADYIRRTAPAAEKPRARK